jgi:uncharacterized protein (DUF1330 family)
MSAYLISEIEVLDAERYKAYKQLAPASIAAYGGRFIARGTPLEALEGEWLPKRFVILEFPSVERAKEWWSSTAYADAKALRQATTKTNMILVEGS